MKRRQIPSESIRIRDGEEREKRGVQMGKRMLGNVLIIRREELGAEQRQKLFDGL